MRAVIYCRISQDREGANLGVDRQEEDCRKLAERLGYRVIDVFVDNDISAFTVNVRRPRAGYGKLLGCIVEGRADAVIAWHTDRLHRSPVELEEYIDVCQPRSLPTYTVKAGDLDLTTAAGRLVARMLGAQARYQSEHMSEQIKRKREQLVMSGKSPGGPRAFGFEKDGITIRESEAAEIARAVQSVARGGSVYSIVKDWNARGIPTSHGNQWTLSSLRNMLVRPRNAGIIVYKGKESGAAPWRPIVDELTWRQMRAVLADPARRSAQNNRVNSLGSGLYLCGKCGAPMRMGTSGEGAKVRGYRCSAHHHLTQAAAPLDDLVIRRLGHLVTRPEVLALAATPEDRRDGREQDRVDAANARLAELGELFAAGEIDGRSLASATEKLRGQIAEAERAMAGASMEPIAELADLAERIFWEPLGAIKALDLQSQRRLLAFAAVVTVMPSEVRGGRFDPGRIRFEWTPEVRSVVAGLVS